MSTATSGLLADEDIGGWEGVPPVVVGATDRRWQNAESVAFSPDGRRVAAAFGGPAGARENREHQSGVIVWDTDTGKRLWVHEQYGDILKLRFTSDGRWLVYSRTYTPGDSVRDDLVVALNGATGRTARVFANAGVFSIASGNRLLLPRHGNLQMFALGQPAHEAAVLEPVPGLQHLSTFADGKRLAAIRHLSENSGTTGIRITDPETSALITQIEDAELTSCHALRVSPSGDRLVTASEGLVRVWDAASLRVVQVLRLPNALYVCAAFSPDGHLLALLSQEAEIPTWRYANTPSGFSTEVVKVGKQTDLAIYSFRERMFIRRWQFEHGSFPTWHWGTNVLAHDPQRVAFSPDGRQLLVGCNGLTRLDIASGRTLRTYKPNSPNHEFMKGE